MLTTRQKDYGHCSKNASSGKRTVKQPMSVIVQTFDRQRADTSAIPSLDDAPVKEVDNLVNSASDGLITGINTSPPEVEKDEFKCTR